MAFPGARRATDPQHLVFFARFFFVEPSNSASIFFVPVRLYPACGFAELRPLWRKLEAIIR